MVEWRRVARVLRFYNLRVRSGRIRYIHDGSEVLRAKRERVFQGKAIGKVRVEKAYTGCRRTPKIPLFVMSLLSAPVPLLTL